MDPFQALNNTFDNIDSMIGNIRNNVDIYSDDVKQLSLLHTAITEQALESEDTILYLTRLTELLNDELERIEQDKGDSASIIATLEDRIRQQSSEITRLTTSIDALEAHVVQQTNNLQNRANGQIAVLDAIQASLGNSNRTFRNTSQNILDTQNKIANLKRKRTDEIANIQSKIQRREQLSDKIQNLDKERAELKQTLRAVETLPLISSENDTMSDATSETLNNDDDDDDDDDNDSDNSASTSGTESSIPRTMPRLAAQVNPANILPGRRNRRRNR